MNKKEIKKGRHSQEPLLGISLLCVVSKMGKIPYLIKDKKAGDPRQKHSGMTPLFNNGFTLIELLVVVLIIGILAAIALPQYKKAVEKTKISAMLPTVKSLAEANELYYMENNSYTTNVENLTFTMPEECSKLTTQLWKCGTDFLLDNSTQSTILSYCPGTNTSHSACIDVRDLHFHAIHQHASEGLPGKWRCFGITTKGRALCKSLGY